MSNLKDIIRKADNVLKKPDLVEVDDIRNYRRVLIQNQKELQTALENKEEIERLPYEDDPNLMEDFNKCVAFIEGFEKTFSKKQLEKSKTELSSVVSRKFQNKIEELKRNALTLHKACSAGTRGYVLAPFLWREGEKTWEAVLELNVADGNGYPYRIYIKREFSFSVKNLNNRREKQETWIKLCPGNEFRTPKGEPYFPDYLRGVLISLWKKEEKTKM